jgi:hypothetical protein
MYKIILDTSLLEMVFYNISCSESLVLTTSVASRPAAECSVLEVQ